MQKERKTIFQTFKSREDSKRTPYEKFADLMTQKFGSIFFLALNVFWFGAWIVWNLGVIPGVKPFDPYPFGLLTMIVSLEAIVLAIVVLISQNRASRVAELREELTLKIDVIIEQEITKALKLMVDHITKTGVNVADDRELKHMLRPTDLEKIEATLENDISNS
jgi:uncharacterized membrane protein